ncbi:MAG: DUF4080 domain-containing protein [Christensenellaceae bacterium]
MKTLLIAINSSYVHTNLAVRSILAASKNPMELREYNINQQLSDVVSDLLDAEIAAFSCYIWNIDYVLKAAQDLKKINPSVKIVLGGPQVTFDAYEVMQKNDFVDYILCGEAELVFDDLINQIQAADNQNLEDFKMDGILYRNEKQICGNDTYQFLKNMDDLLLYKEEYNCNKLYYYESTRGCPFCCAYCLSGALPCGVREKSLEKVFRDIDVFVKNDVKLVKFVDRTFNANKQRAKKIIEYVIDHTKNTSFHFEIALDLVDEEMLILFEHAPVGKIQLEAGVQSCNEKTLHTVIRKTNINKVCENAQKILKNQNIHLHLDLIAGLPFEDLNSFAHSFDTVYDLYADALQLGFLKLLKGSSLYEKSAEYGIIARSYPPFEVLKTNEMTAADLFYFKGVEEQLNRYYNTGRARKALDYLTKNKIMQPYELYSKLYDFSIIKGCTKRPVGALNQFVFLIDFAKEYLNEPTEFYKNLKTDYINTKIKGIMPIELQEN